MPQSFPSILRLFFCLIQLSHGCCKPLTIFQSSDKVGSDSFSLVFFFFGVSVGEHELTAYPLHQFADIPPQLHCWEWLFLLLPSSGPGTWVILTKSTLTKSLNWCMTSAYCRVSLKGHGKQSRNKFNLVNVPTGHTFYPFAVVNTVQQCLHHSGRVAKVSPHLQLIVKGYFLKCCAEW